MASSAAKAVAHGLLDQARASGVSGKSLDRTSGSGSETELAAQQAQKEKQQHERRQQYLALSCVVQPSEKADRIAALDTSSLPESYRSLELKEQLALEYVKQFQTQFEALYPQRPPLYVSPVNECGVAKFVCTTLRPTQLCYTELYTYPGAAKFVSGALLYEKLAEETAPPRSLPSPTTVLAAQRGDCFDMAMLLTSLLLGVGYDAYVVYGYASKSLTMRDQSRLIYPGLRQSKDSDTTSGTGKKPYARKPERPTLKSKFLEQVEEKRRAEEMAHAQTDGATGVPLTLEDGSANLEWFAKQERSAQQLVAQDAAEDGAMHGRRVHCWVMLLAGKRGVAKPVFIEPTTAMQHEITSPLYLGVEAVWNNTNYWVNMQENAAFHNVDLHDANAWEFMYVDTSSTSGAAVTDDYDLPETAASAASDAKRSGSSGAAAAAGASTATGSVRATSSVSQGHVGSTAAAAGSTSLASHGADGRDSAAVAAATAATRDAAARTEVLDLPSSWVSRITCSRDVFEQQFPASCRCTLYLHCRVEEYAAYSREDGMVAKVTIYADDEWTEAFEVRELFQHRKDKLYERRKYLLQDRRHEWFHAGRAYALKELIVDDQRRIRDYYFYHDAKLNGLVHRHEEIGKKVTEIFAGRPDRLTYRSVAYEPPGKMTNLYAVIRNLNRDSTDSPVRKMTEQYERNTSVPADSDVAKRTFFVTEEKIELVFHRAAHRITASSRTYYKDGQSSVTTVDPYAEPPKKAFLLDEYQRLTIAEKECGFAIRESEREARQISKNRQAEESQIQLEVSVYDTRRNPAIKRDAEKMAQVKEEMAAQHSVRDYLTPFLPKDWKEGERSLTHAEAVTAHDNCLKALKERLIEKANLIQNRLDEETGNLARRQTAYQRNQEQLDRAEEDEYNRYCNEAMFRIHILEQRLADHEHTALQKFADMDARLLADARLAILGGGGN